MTFTGIIRGVDRLGRVVLPKKLRTSLNINELIDPIEIYLSENSIVLSKANTTDDLPLGDRRSLDNFGRIVIPVEIRTHLGIVPQVDTVEIHSDGHSIILKKHESACVFCGSIKDTFVFKSKTGCKECAKELSK